MNAVPIPAAAPRKYRMAVRVSKMKTSAVREILKVTERPEVLSFAGGLPAPELFPAQPLAQALSEVLERDGAAAMQYSTTEGWRPLREWIASRVRTQGIAATADRVLITSGSQQGIDLIAKVFLDREIKWWLKTHAISPRCKRLEASKPRSSRWAVTKTECGWTS